MQQKILPLIRFLSDGKFHSGESIASLIGISRTAVWKKVQKCVELGVEIESVKGKGYRIVTPFDLLESHLIINGLSDAAVEQFQLIDVFEEIGSTNRYALDYVDKNGKTPYLCFAEYQTGGRGRRGRDWHSPLGNIAFSLVWSFEQGASATEGLSLLIGLALARALEQEGVLGVQLKWPNDVLLNQAKLAGILLEMKGDPQGLCHIVIGVGINIAVQTDTEVIDQAFVSVFDVKPNMSRNQFCAQLLNQLAAMLPVFSVQGFAPFKEQWAQYDAYANQPVSLSAGERYQQGMARGINEKGALLLQDELGLHEIYAGELSLRPLNDS